MEEVKRLVCADEKMVLSKEALGILVSNTFVSYNGVVYKTCDLLQKHCCHSCSTLLLQNHALQLQLKNEAKVPIEVVLRGFFEERYVPTVKCVYSRKKLFREVVAYLKGTYHLRLLTPSGPVYKWFLKEVVKDSSRNYKKLKIRQK